jgi:LysM repeat protein
VSRTFVALLGTVVVAVLLAAGRATPAATPSARVTLEASTGSSVLVPTEATLDCGDRARGTGFLARAAKPACALVRQGVLTDIAKEHRVARVCTEVYGGPQRARISGTVGRGRVALSIDRGDGCGIGDWDRLRALLGDPERSGVIPRPSTSTTTTTVPPPATYHVARGDTLTEIAKQFKTSVGAIVAANRLVDPDHLVEGQALVMPPPSAVHIDAALVNDTAGEALGLKLVGAQESELVTFVITLPDGNTYTGSPHAAAGDGTVSTTYTDALGSGTYRVTASGTAGTNAETAFHVDPPG